MYDGGSFPAGSCQQCGELILDLRVGDSCPNCGKLIGGLCRGCGYDLAGLLASSNCPECGKLVTASLRGDRLRDASREYVTALHQGVRCVLASIALLVVMVMAVILGTVVFDAMGADLGANFRKAAAWGMRGVALLSATLAVFGWFRLTTPEPALHIVDTADRHRQWARFLVVALVAQSVLSIGLAMIDPKAASAPSGSGPMASVIHAIEWAGLVIGVAQFVFSMNYLKWLADKVPDRALGRRAARYRWLLPLWFFPGMLLCFLGPLVALILYDNLLNDFRRVLKRILADPTFQPPPATGR